VTWCSSFLWYYISPSSSPLTWCRNLTSPPWWGDYGVFNRRDLQYTKAISGNHQWHDRNPYRKWCYTVMELFIVIVAIGIVVPISRYNRNITRTTLSGPRQQFEMAEDDV
jgi:hypothetical protein